jgi:hypothetical protein
MDRQEQVGLTRYVPSEYTKVLVVQANQICVSIIEKNISALPSAYLVGSSRFGENVLCCL